MAFFGSSGPSPEEMQQAAVIKPVLTSNLKDALKELQRRNVNSQEAIHSEDTANAVCNVLEAIFLHGLKASFSKKVSHLMTGFNEEKDFSFWEFVVLFSHRDTVSHLKRLGQITTHVGMCRAWIRLALNDGLLDSYLESMLRDKKTLQTHYRRLAYLRDPEQPEIMKTYMQGILNFRFELSYNSSVLNMWTVTPLVLAGLADSQVTPQAVVRPTPAEEAFPEAVVVKNDGLTRNTRLITSMDLNTGTTPLDNAGATSENEFQDHSELTQTEIEQICQMMNEQPKKKHSAHSEDSFGTAASQISMPDPKDMREFPQDTMSPKHVKPKDNYSKNSDNFTKGEFESEGVHVKDKSTKSKKHKHKHKKKKKKALDIPENNLEEDLPDTISFQSANSDNVGSFKSLNTFLDGENPINPLAFANDEYDIISTNDDILSGGNNYCDKLIQKTDQNSNQESKALGTLPNDREEFSKPVENLSNKYDQNHTNDINNGSCGEGNSKDHDNDKDDIRIIVPENLEATNPFSERLEASGTHSHDSTNSGAGSGSFQNFRRSQKGDILPPELSNAVAVANSVEQAEDAEVLETSGQLDLREEEEDSIFTSYSNSGKQTNESQEKGSQRQQSNSLSHSLAQGGWSGPFSEEDEVEDVYLRSNVQSMFPNLDVKDTPRAADEKVPDDTVAENAGWAISSRNVIKPLSPSEEEVAAFSNTVSSSGQDLCESIYYEGFEILPASGEIAGQLEDSKVIEFKEQIACLAQERGLDVQNFQCNGCKRSVGMFFCQPRICGFDGANYCYDCHENEEFYIPARIALNWDFRKHLICKDNLLLLRQFEDSPLLNVFQINPRIYDHVKIMSEVKDLRQQLRYLKAYLFTCKQSVAEEFRQQVWPKEYLYDDVNMYSLLDLLQVVSGQLAASLRKVIKSTSHHVYQCRLCSQKGFICEICNNSKVIYPFEMESTKKCKSCDAVFHKACKTDLVPCPKCRRIMERQIKIGKRASVVGNNDYVFAPSQNPISPVHFGDTYSNSSLQAGST